MAIDPRIAMGAQAPNLQSSIGLFQNTLNNIQNRKMNDQTMAQNKELQPLRVEQAQQGLDINQGKLDTNRQNELIRSIVDFSPTLKPLNVLTPSSGFITFFSLIVYFEPGTNFQ